MIQYLWAGFLLQASLIFALGAQNLFLLDAGVRDRRPHLAALICFLCDLTLIMIGVCGTSALLLRFPLLKAGFGILGVIFLFLYGVTKLKEAVAKQKSMELSDDKKRTIQETVLMGLGFSLLNPHAYLDAIVLIGGVSTKFNDLSARVQFGLGAALCSLVWFLVLVTFSGKMSKVFKNPAAVRSLGLASGVLLVWLSIKLGSDVRHWVVASL